MLRNVVAAAAAARELATALRRVRALERDRRLRRAVVDLLDQPRFAFELDLGAFVRRIVERVQPHAADVSFRGDEENGVGRHRSRTCPLNACAEPNGAAT